VTTPQLSDERLAWLAVRDEIQKMPRQKAFGVKGQFGKLVGRNNRSRTVAEERYATAVDELVRRMCAEDRRILRSTGKVPEWFIPTARLEARCTRLG
jgi:hypothetical protein